MAIGAGGTPTELPFFVRIFVAIRTDLMLELELSRDERSALGLSFVALRAA